MKRRLMLPLQALTLVSSVAMAVPPLSTPWPCDVSYRITQGHNTGSHTDNGAWAWDIGIPVGGDVTAPADGVVRRIRMDSTRGGCSSSYGNDANYVVIDFGDGTEALLLHLEQNSSSLQVGDRVQRGQVVGRVGLTGWVCGAHLHFQIQQTCSSWWCPSIPASFEAYGDPTSGTYASDNCPSCAVVATMAAEALVDEKDPGCFKRATSYWWSVSEGHDGHHYYTFATDAAGPDTVGTWLFDVGEAGRYHVHAHVPQTEADAQNVSYIIQTGQAETTVGPVNQAAQKGWVDLGTHDFAGGEDRSVRVGDNTGENYDLRRKIAFDALRLTPVPPEPEPEPGPTDPVEPNPNPEDPTLPEPPLPTDDTTEPDLGSDPAETADNGSTEVRVDDGCSATGNAGLAWFGLLGLWGFRRRK